LCSGLDVIIVLMDACRTTMLYLLPHLS
jgi:hypothetical protein